MSGMVDKVYCTECAIYRQVDIIDVVNQGKKRVVCGPCGKVLLCEDDILDYFYYVDLYSDPWFYTC